MPNVVLVSVDNVEQKGDNKIYCINYNRHLRGLFSLSALNYNK